MIQKDNVVDLPRTTRVSLDLTQEQNDTLERLARKSGRSKAELLRLALEVMASASDLKTQGFEVGGWMDDYEKGVRRERTFQGVP
jgi:predicted transcriptional regulator